MTFMTWPIAGRAGGASLGDRGCHHGGQLIVVELRGQVAGQHLLLGPLRGRLVVAARVREGGRGLAAPLSLPGQDLDDLIVGEVMSRRAGRLPRY